MHMKYEILWLAVCTIDICTCQTDEVNETVVSRREILEKQALRAYQNACFGLQELSNWMSVVFKMKSVWTSSTIVQMEENSGKTQDTGLRKLPPLPPRPKTSSSECSLKSAQVTLQTYAHLQGQLFYLKSLLGRNIVKTSSERLGDANVSIRERIKTLDVFNETLNDILSKLRQNTQELSSSGRSESWNVRNLFKDLQEGRFPKILPISSNIFQVPPDRKEIENTGTPRSRGIFQTLGKAFDKILFPTSVSNSIPAEEKAADGNLETLEMDGKNERSETVKMET